MRNFAIATRSAILLVSAGFSDPQPVAKALGTVKFFTSMKWKPKFDGVVDQFTAHKKELLADIQFHTSIMATKTYDLLSSVDDKINSMKAMIEVAFEKMQTPEERELTAFAQKNGGTERVLENGMFMKKVLEMEKQKTPTEDDKGPTSGKSGAPAQSALTQPELEKEIRKDVDAILQENTGAFDRKFGAIELSLREVNVTIQRQSDRVISEVLAGMQAGPHERIKDKVCGPDF